jgi:drug/metabolite transporter (DMT)-like permease
MVSVLYRFIAAAVILLVYCKLRGLNMRFRLKDHIFMALQGLVLFSVNYWLIYLAEVHVTSGLVAVIFSSIVFMNMVNGAVLLGSPIRSNVVLGGGIGVLGIVLVFWPQLVSFSLSDKTALGLLLTVVSTFMASLGNIISARHQKYNLPVIQTNAYGMAYGAVIIGVIAIFLGKPFNFEISFQYISSLFYLSLFGTVIAFGCYLKLIGEIGADRAAYATMLFPIVALGISTVYEGYQWAAHNVIGMAIVLIGNWLVLNKKAMAKRLSSE